MILSLKLSDNITCIFLTCRISWGKVGWKSRTETTCVMPRDVATAGSWAMWRSERYNLGIMRSGLRIGSMVIFVRRGKEAKKGRVGGEPSGGGRKERGRWTTPPFFFLLPSASGVSKCP